MLSSFPSIEEKGNDFLISFEVPENTDKGKIAKDFLMMYNHIKKIESKNKQLEADNQQLQADIREIAKEIARNPVKITTIVTSGNPSMNDNTINIGGNVTSSTINLGEINGAVSNTLNQLPDAHDTNQTGLKEHLIELQAKIEAENDLSPEDKADALDAIKTLAEISQKPHSSENLGIVRKALKLLKGTISCLPEASKFVESCSRLLPTISNLFGL